LIAGIMGAYRYCDFFFIFFSWQNDIGSQGAMRTICNIINFILFPLMLFCTKNKEGSGQGRTQGYKFWNI
jgi:hypothetical protein